MSKLKGKKTEDEGRGPSQEKAAAHLIRLEKKTRSLRPRRRRLDELMKHAVNATRNGKVKMR